MKPIRQLTMILLAASILFHFGCASQIARPDQADQSSQDDWKTSRDEYQENDISDASNSLPFEQKDHDQINLSDPTHIGSASSGSEFGSEPLSKNPAQLGSNDQTAESAGKVEPQTKREQPILDEALDFCEVAQDFWQKGELENALDALDKAYALILNVDLETDAKLFQQKEDLRYLISKRILEIYASRNIVVNGNYDAIPIELNRHVQAELKLFTTGAESSFFQQSYQRSGKYRPYIVEALKEAGLPEELSWIPLIESGFKVKALSKARALGLWQFIPSTGYKFGLKRDKFIDERIDPYKATHAAIAYLKELHNIFGDWSTVLAAYNCGEGRVLRVIRSQNINYLDNFWDLYERLPRETARYVPRFIATLHIVKNPEKYGLDHIAKATPLPNDIIEVNRQVHLKDLAKTLEIPLTNLKDLNPELRYNILPPEKYQLRVPPGKDEGLLAEIDTIPLSNPPQRAYVWHKVRKGETISTIARRYHTSVGNIMRANGIRQSHYIMAGKTLKIPQKGYITSPPVARTTATNNLTTQSYRVKRGDSLWILAKRYGTTTKTIQDLNNLNSTRLYAGQVLKVPGQNSAGSSDAATNGTYFVRSGDSPSAIARRHQMSLTRLLELNNLTSKSTIYPGQQLTVD